jgi:hypothetical protein
MRSRTVLVAVGRAPSKQVFVIVHNHSVEPASKTPAPPGAAK